MALAILVPPTFQAVPERARVQLDLSTQQGRQGGMGRRREASAEPNSLSPELVELFHYLWYDQIVEGQWPDVWIVDDRTRSSENLGEVTDVIDANLGRATGVHGPAARGRGHGRDRGLRVKLRDADRAVVSTR